MWVTRSTTKGSTSHFRNNSGLEAIACLDATLWDGHEEGSSLTFDVNYEEAGKNKNDCDE